MPEALRGAAGDPAHARGATTGTCRTRSSRWRRGSLYMLQTRNAKRPAQAAVRFAVDAVEEGLLDKRGGDRDDRRRPRSTRCCTPRFDRDAEFDVLAEGVAASPGAAKGEIVFTADDAVAAAEDGRDVILVRPFTEADDVAGFHAAQGHPHHRGRQGQPRRAGGARDGQAVRVGRRRRSTSTCTPKTLRVNGTELGEGDLIAIDGSAGVVTADDVPLEEPEVSRRVRDGARLGRRAPHAGRAHERRHPRGRRAAPASSAPRASASAAPSTCSWPRTASRRCAR